MAFLILSTSSSCHVEASVEIRGTGLILLICENRLPSEVDGTSEVAIPARVFIFDWEKSGDSCASPRLRIGMLNIGVARDEYAEYAIDGYLNLLNAP
jgi:hypothetical protein